MSRQFRTGVSSLLMQSGTVIQGTAPVLAASLGAGPQLVPYLAIPLTLLNAPLGILSNFSASLQSGYGEAMGRGESGWVADTVNLILRQALVLMGLLGCGWILLAGDFVEAWTRGRIELSPVMVINALMIAGSGAVITTMRYALTGINRHRNAAMGELIGGLLALVSGIVVVRLFGFAWVGAAIFVPILLVTGWLYPLELKKALGGTGFIPRGRFWLSLFATSALSFGAGWATKFAMTSLPPWPTILATGVVVTAVFLFFACRWMRKEIDFVTNRLFRPFASLRRSAESEKVIRHS